MMLSPRVLGVFVAAGLAVFVALNAAILSQDRDIPKIQGVIIPQGRDIAEFSVVNQQGILFSKQDLIGTWSLISYGFTDCPDICPTTLSKLALLKKRLDVHDTVDDLQLLFYTIDPQRDTPAHLKEYVSFFHKDLIGLSYSPELGTNHIPLEHSLGMVSAITPLSEDDAKDDYKGYSVSHGVLLYLVNPKGELQAIFKPRSTAQGLQYFDVETLLKDYLAIRTFTG